MPTRPTILEIRPSSSPSSIQGTSTSLTSPNPIIPAPSSSSYPSANSSSSSSPYQIQRCTSASSYPPSSGYSSSGAIAGGLLSTQTTGIRGRKSFGELSREIQKIVRPPRERARGLCGIPGRRTEKEKGNKEVLCGLGRCPNRGRIYSGVSKRAAGKRVGKGVQRKEEKVEVDVEAGLRRTICSGQGGSVRDGACKCDGWKLVPREGAGAGSPGVSGTKMALCNQFIELLKQRYAEEDE